MKNQTYRMTMLYDFYGDLLTPRQRELYDLYYNQDLSLSEIAENFEISRQGVRDTIVRAERFLEEIEEKTSLIQRYHRTRAAADSLQALCQKLCTLNQTKLKNRELETLCTQMQNAVDELRRD